MGHNTFFSKFLVIIFLFTAIIMGQTVKGTSSITLNSPVTPELKRDQRSKAFKSFSFSMDRWIKKYFNISYRDSDSISKYFLMQFKQKCSDLAQESSSINKRTWKLTITLPDHILDSAAAAHNTYYSNLTKKHYNAMLQAEQNNDLPDQLTQTLASYFYAHAHIGERAPNGATPETDKQALRLRLQKLINQVSVTFNTPVIKGRAGHPPHETVNVQAKIGNTPIPNFPISCSLGSLTIFEILCNKFGFADFSTFKIPFVPNGSIINVKADLLKLVDPSLEINPKVLGLDLDGDTDQILMLNVRPALATIDFMAHSANQLPVSNAFSNKLQVEKFLKDSCSVYKPLATETPQYNITIRCQLSSYTFDQTEKKHVKMEVFMEITDKKSGKRHTISDVINQKKYSSETVVFEGKFFWESSINLKQLIKKTLNQMTF